MDKVHFKFACESKGERDAWVSDIKKACNGMVVGFIIASLFLVVVVAMNA